mmetsp:Transcript_2320/g.5776  ORF Transcript_2320/g.5776 Transcript_2320/m.5776 type:complete len:422 (-) Transcript_2320:118-1383(-)
MDSPQGSFPMPPADGPPAEPVPKTSTPQESAPEADAPTQPVPAEVPPQPAPEAEAPIASQEIPTPGSPADSDSTSSANSTEDANATMEPPKPKFAKAWATCGGPRYTGPTVCEEGFRCAHLSKYFAQCKPESEVAWKTWKPDVSVESVSKAPVHTYYMYRATGPQTYALSNVNSASLGGVMWYVHNEVVSCIYQDCDQVRRYGIDRIRRYKVQTRATEKLWKAGLNFGIRYAFDLGQCTGPWVCNDQFNKYGYFVGCNNLSSMFPFPNWPVYYSGAWYSLPGACSEMQYKGSTLDCQADQPGGLCTGTPTGQGNCTYSVEDAGEVLLNDLENITNYEAFKLDGGEEYNKTTDVGINMTFWNGINDTKANAKRVRVVDQMFKAKYPDMPSDAQMPPPKCDFDLKKFFPDGLPTELNPNAHPR